jgi:hypothetical protein
MCLRFDAIDQFDGVDGWFGRSLRLFHLAVCIVLFLFILFYSIFVISWEVNRKRRDGGRTSANADRSVRIETPRHLTLFYPSQQKETGSGCNIIAKLQICAFLLIQKF